jgi:arylsulfatase A-like enzyme
MNPHARYSPHLSGLRPELAENEVQLPGMTRLIDDQFARLLQFMHENKLLDNTILVFTADYGRLDHDETDSIDFRQAKIPGPPGAIESFDELNSYTQSGYLKMVRMGDWKLAFDMMGNGQLYNLAADPSELSRIHVVAS